MTNKKQKNVVIITVAAVWWTVSFFLEPFVFDISQRNANLFRYLLVRILCFGALLLCSSYFYHLLEGIIHRKKNHAVLSAVYAVPVWIVLFAVVFVKKREIGGEESDLIEAAAHYDLMNCVFTYITPCVEMIMMMIIPSVKSPLMIKIFLLGLEAGYAVERTAKIYGSRLFPCLLYLGFLLPPALRESCNIHRCPMYGMLFFFLAVKLFCDWKEHKAPYSKNLLICAFMVAVLTWWRAEGIYFLVLGPVLYALAYRIPCQKKTMGGVVCVFIAAQVLVWLPKTTAPKLTIENYEKHQLTPFYNYALTGMLCSGLDREKNADDLAVIEEYMHIDFIDILYDMYGEHIFDEGHATYHQDYSGVNKHATEELLNTYEKTVRHLILKNPLLFIQSQIRAFNHISFHYDSLCLSSLFGNLWVVVLWLVGILVWSVIRRQWFLFFLTLCPVCHGCISTVFLPAAYFKYYYPEYLYAWLLVAIAVSSFAMSVRNKRKNS